MIFADKLSPTYVTDKIVDQYLYVVLVLYKSLVLRIHWYLAVKNCGKNKIYVLTSFLTLVEKIILSKLEMQSIHDETKSLAATALRSRFVDGFIASCTRDTFDTMRKRFVIRTTPLTIQAHFLALFLTAPRKWPPYIFPSSKH